MSFIKHETIADYCGAIRSIEQRGYVIKGIIIDGMRSLFGEFANYRLQMCQFHMLQITRRYLTKKPRLMASRELRNLMSSLTNITVQEFCVQYAAWKERWNGTINRRTMSQVSGKSHYTHKKLRTLVNSIDFYQPFLFTYQDPQCEGMPNTNNKIEGTFTDLKKNLNNHSGMSVENRKRFINGFFLALANTSLQKRREKE